MQLSVSSSSWSSENMTMVFIHFIWHLFSSAPKWKATSQSLVHSMGPLIRVGGHVCFLIPALWLRQWFDFHKSLLCVLKACPCQCTVLSLKGEREKEFRDALEGKWIKHAPALYAAQHLIALSHDVYVEVCVSAQMYVDFSLPSPPLFHSPL